MTEAERESNREFVQRWKRAEPLLIRLRQRALREKRHDEVAIFEWLLDFAYGGSPRYTNGLVQLQKLLARAPGRSS